MIIVIVLWQSSITRSTFAINRLTQCSSDNEMVWSMSTQYLLCKSNKYVLQPYQMCLIICLLSIHTTEHTKPHVSYIMQEIDSRNQCFEGKSSNLPFQGLNINLSDIFWVQEGKSYGKLFVDVECAWSFYTSKDTSLCISGSPSTIFF